MIFLKFIFWTCLFLVGYSYVLYPILLVVFDKVWIRKRFEKSEELPGISIVIAAYNEEKVIKSRLENCLKVDYPMDKLEIIIASDGSDDRTCEIVRKYSDKGIVLYDYKERRGKVNVLNETVPKAKNDIIVLIPITLTVGQPVNINIKYDCFLFGFILSTIKTNIVNNWMWIVNV